MHFHSLALHIHVNRSLLTETGAHDSSFWFCCTADKPQAPRNIRVRDVWKDYVNISWDLPESDGGSPITGYNIEVRDAYEISFKYVGTVDASTVHYQVRDLSKNIGYCLEAHFLQCFPETMHTHGGWGRDVTIP